MKKNKKEQKAKNLKNATELPPSSKYNKIIIAIIIIISIIIVIIFTTKHNNNSKTNNNSENVFSTIMEKIEKKDDFLIFVTDTSSACNYCKNSTRYIKLYKEIYNLNMITYDKNKNSPENYEKIEKALQLAKTPQEDWITAPAIIIVKNGIWSTVVNENIFENDLKTYLIKNNLIDEEEIKKEITLTDENFDEILKQPKISLAYIYTYNDESYEIRKRIIKLAKKYEFNYSIIQYGFGATAKIIDTLAQQDKLSVPSLIILGNNKIIDTTDKLTDNEIIKFLKKNKIIK